MIPYNRPPTGPAMTKAAVLSKAESALVALEARARRDPGVSVDRHAFLIEAKYAIRKLRSLVDGEAIRKGQAAETEGQPETVADWRRNLDVLIHNSQRSKR